MKKISRRKMIQFGVLSTLAGAFGVNKGIAKALALVPTPDETEGPFYPTADQKDKNADLTQIDGHAIAAQGRHIIVSGRVQDVAGDPVGQAMLDIWQADANGRYRHPRDPNPAKADENFQGWAILRCDENGFFRFKTVMPGAYPASGAWIRPPHIHFKISKPGYRSLTTQMYFPDERLNNSDLLLNAKSPAERAAMTARLIAQQGNLPIYEYNIVLDLLRSE
ncbi:MAG: protocatechuate 3,4-dioxygenase [Gammaproteobacteria bacterium]|nr:MAG: protocatechuate 3,4-dioxygenase [Gammaproteobacteria bacterium]